MNSKMSNLSDSLQISLEQNLPLVVSAKTGLLGNISIYVKNKSQIAYTQA